jgi:penicillin-binding protein 1A
VRVEDQDGRLMWVPPAAASAAQGLDPRVAYIITDMLRDAVDRGTGTGVRSAGFHGPAAGKTGTTNDAADAWFVGYTPDVVAAVWIGYDQPSSLGSGASGGGFAAPVWGRVMRRTYAVRPAPPVWKAPQGLAERVIDEETGLVLQEGCKPRNGRVATELFLAEYVPAVVCPSRSFWGGLWSRIRGGP